MQYENKPNVAVAMYGDGRGITGVDVYRSEKISFTISRFIFMA